MPDIFSIRHSRPDDLGILCDIFVQARLKMRKAGNPKQWPDSYPSLQQITNDMQQNCSYVVESEGRPVATFVLKFGADPTYARIYNGAWCNADAPYATLHRLASVEGVHGVARYVLRWCAARSVNLRADTHFDNYPVRHVLQAEGFVYCGIICLPNGDTRMAYQRLQSLKS